jgi:hypothetical protein
VEGWYKSVRERCGAGFVLQGVIMSTRTFEVTVARLAIGIDAPSWSQPIETYTMDLWYSESSALIGRCIARVKYRKQYGFRGPLFTRVVEVDR